MKILHVISSLDTGGAERALYNLVAGHIAKGYESEVVSLRGLGSFGALISSLGVPVTALNISGFMSAGLQLSKLRRVLRDFNPDVVQGWMYHGNIAAALSPILAANLKMPVVWNVRHSLHDVRSEKVKTRAVIKLNRLLSNCPNGIVYNSRVARRQHEEFGFSSKCVEVIPNGFDLDCFFPCEKSRTTVRAELGIPADSFAIGHIARFHPMKGHRRFLGVAVELARQYDDVCFIMSGRDVTESNRAVTSLIPEKVRSKFHLLGERSDIPDLMRAMDLFCVSSQWGEAFPNVLGEAMATEVPCLTTDVGDSRWIVQGGGVCVDRSSTRSFHDAIVHILEERQLAKQLGRVARARVEKEFSFDAMISKYSEFYRRFTHFSTDTDY